MHTHRWNIHFSYAFIRKRLHLYSVKLLSVSDPHQELCHWTQASMQTPILGWQNLSILLCFLCMPVQTVINPTSHRSYRSLGNIKHQSLSSNSLTLYVGLTVQCTWRDENLFLKTDNATSSSRLGVLSICTTVYSYFNVTHWKSATQQILTKQFFSKQNMHYST